MYVNRQSGIRKSLLESRGGLARIRTDLPIEVRGTELNRLTGDLDRCPKAFVPVQPIEAGKNLSGTFAGSYINSDYIEEDFAEAAIKNEFGGNKKYFSDYVLNSGNFSIREILELKKAGYVSNS